MNDPLLETLNAIGNDDYRSLDSLLRSVDVNLCDEDGLSLLMNALLTFEHEPDVRMVRFLIDKGADVNTMSRGNWTALHVASRDQRKQIVEVLLEAGADVDAQDEHGNTPLSRGICHNSPNLEIVRALLASGADPAKENKYGNSPIDTARLMGNAQLVTLLENRR
jgi:uncharacterized protein